VEMDKVGIIIVEILETIKVKETITKVEVKEIIKEEKLEMANKCFYCIY
jgi:hypothetical protein